MNINGTNLGRGDHSILQLCQTLYEKRVNLICLTDTNVSWKSHILSRFFFRK